MIAKIIVDQRSKHVDKAFDYLIPEGMEKDINIGTRVLVPFSASNKEVEGFCVGLSDSSDAKRLKKIIRVANDTDAFDESMLSVIEYMHEKYLSPYIDIIHTVVPGGTALKSEEWLTLENMTPQRSQMRERILQLIFDNGGAMPAAMLYSMFETDVRAAVRDMQKKGILGREYRQHSEVGDKVIRGVRLVISPQEATAIADEIRKKAPVQAKMADILSQNEFVSAADLAKLSGGSASAVSALCSKGIAEVFPLVLTRDAFLRQDIKPAVANEPTDEQGIAIDKIKSAIDASSQKTHLLYGVTGSGKTEVFMHAISYAIENGKTALVMVPEISLTSQMVSRFVSRFGSEVAVLHSRLSQGERYDQWKRIKKGEAKIVVGARSAVFAPLKNIGIIIMDEEHSETYKSEMSPRYHTKDIATFRAHQQGGVLLLASATPSMESFYRAKQGEYELIVMKNRYNNASLPEIDVIDMRTELKAGNRSMFSKRLTDEIKENLGRGEQTILLMNRRGFSSFVSCRSCGYVAECPNCNISLTYHKYEDNLKCHYCGYTVANYKTCPQCGSKYIRYFGGGTQRVEEEIAEMFPKASTIRMDIDTTSKKWGHEKILTAFEDDKIDILIGTQMVSKGLDFENVTLVGVISADTMLNINDYRSRERTFSLLEQVCGRAGRGSKKGRAVVQTYTPESSAIELVKTHNYEGFYKEEISERKMLMYPPFSKITAICFSGSIAGEVSYAAKLFKKAMGDDALVNGKITVLGPIPAAIAKIKNKYRWQIIIKSQDDEIINDMLSVAHKACIEDDNCNGVAIVIDKNPNILF